MRIELTEDKTDKELDDFLAGKQTLSMAGSTVDVKSENNIFAQKKLPNQNQTAFSYNDFINYAPLIEPQVFIRFGGKKLKGSLRVSYCTFLGMENFVYFPANISIGISYKFELKR